MKKAFVFLFVIIAAAAMMVFWTNKKSPNSPAKVSRMKVTTSFYPLYFFASQIGDDKIDVVNITPAGAEPHDYEPTAKDIARMEESRVLILNGAIEPWGDNVKQNTDPAQTLVITAGQGLFTQQKSKDGKDSADPHVWLSPPLAKQMVESIARGFARVDPEHADEYAANARALQSKLEDLDASYRLGLSDCAKKDIITAHAAFGYLATIYHFNQIPITGLSPDAEPSPRQLADIADFAKENKIKVIFFEKLASPKLSQAIATEIGAKTMELNPLEGLTNDDIAAGKNYLTEMRQNLANLNIALECTQ